MDRKIYENPLVTKYASKEMSGIFSDDNRHRTWRMLWIVLARFEQRLGIDIITDNQIDQMRQHYYTIDYDMVEQMEKEFKHDVMAHIHAFGIDCPDAKPIIHLGATSSYVTDNADILLMEEALRLIRSDLLNIMRVLSNFCMNYKDLPTLGFTHFQPAQLTTVGKRASLWLQDLYMDYEQLEFCINNLRFRGVKGATGTQASFMKLLDGDSEKVKMLDKMVSNEFGFKPIPLAGQTYTRKIDTMVANVLSGIAQSLHKAMNDIRLLQGLGELEEPFERGQVGSSAMAYKRNPIMCERVTSLSRFIVANASNMYNTMCEQWLERTLDDSANRRISIPQGFLACDAILGMATNIFDGLVVNEKVIAKHIDDELPFMATENIIMECVKRGKDRQEVHEEIRKLSMMARDRIKSGKPNELILYMLHSDVICLFEDEIDEILDPIKFTGRASEQVEDFYYQVISPLLRKEGAI